MSFYFSKDLLKRFNQKEPDAQLRVYNEFYPFVYGVVRKKTSGSPECKDMVADIFLKVLRSPGQFKNEAGLTEFIYKVTRNRCIDYARRRIVKHKWLGETRLLSDQFEENQLEEAEAKALFDKKISDSIEELPRRCRYIFMLFYYQRLTNKEIATKLGIREKTVANQKTIAIRLLKIKISNMNGASVTILIFLYHWASHYHQFFRVIRSVLG
jgi:RNA polymerase sigma factor (sigma-70 family)